MPAIAGNENAGGQDAMLRAGPASKAARAMHSEINIAVDGTMKK
jgi:hypothetical protein